MSLDIEETLGLVKFDIEEESQEEFQGFVDDNIEDIYYECIYEENGIIALT